VTTAAAATGLPLGNNGNQTSFVIEGQPLPERGHTPLTEVMYVSQDYFRAMGMTLLSGREFTDQDSRDAPRVTVIDESFAKRHWPDEDPIGKHVRFGGSDPRNPLVTVVGVVGRVKMEGLDADSNRVQSYQPYQQSTWNSMTFILRTPGDPAGLVESVRQQVWSVDKDQPVYNIRTMEQIRNESVAPQRLNMLLLGIFAGVAMVLAAVGIYGVMSYSVTQRTHEIGIRMALGARGGDVIRLVVGQGMVLALVGIGIGLAASFALTRVMTSLLFGVSATDPATFAAISLLLLGVALAACFIPARRAMKVDPMVALRYE
jgi:putative ABC transport system permease protein